MNRRTAIREMRAAFGRLTPTQRKRLAWHVWGARTPSFATGVSPSPLVNKEEAGDHPRCHIFIRDGRIQYLNDCTHALAGQTVDMIPPP